MQGKMKVITSVVTSVCVIGTMTYAFAGGKTTSMQFPFDKKAYVDKECPVLTDEQKSEMRQKLAAKLAEDVKAGKITQEEADQRLKDFDEGKPMFERGSRPDGKAGCAKAPEMTEEQKAEMKQKFADKLALNVADGIITQEEADKKLKAFDDGSLMFKQGTHFGGAKIIDRPEMTDAEKAEIRQKVADSLAAGVKDGTITQEEADQRLKGYDNGNMMFKQGRSDGSKMMRKVEMTDEQKAEMRQKFADKLAKDVEGGKITQEEADKQLKAFDDGEFMPVEGSARKSGEMPKGGKGGGQGKHSGMGQGTRIKGERQTVNANS